MNLELTHYSGTPDPLVLRPALRPQGKDERSHDSILGKLAHKPAGALWLSDDRFYGWREWCLDNQFGTEGLRYRRTVVLDLDRTLVIPTAEALDRFTEWYGVDRMPTYHFREDSARGQMGPSVQPFQSGDLIDWHGVMQDHGAVFISPYRWDRRLESNTRWYYAWDCASAAVLDPAAVVRVTDPLPVPCALLGPAISPVRPENLSE